MKKFLLIIFAVVVFLIFAVIVFDGLNSVIKSNQSSSSKKETSSDIQPTINPKGVDNSKYAEYSPEKLANITTDKTILFFKASWCPTCRVLDQDIQENLDKIPDDVTILAADYDKEKELKKEYKVATQHTLVVLDSNGQEVQKWTGILSLDSLIETVNN